MPLPTFDKNRMRKKKEAYLEVIDQQLSEKYQSEISDLQGFDDELLTEFGGTTEQLNHIIAELETAKNQNLSQASLIANLKALGSSTYELARKVSELVP